MENAVIDFDDWGQKDKFINYLKGFKGIRIIHMEHPALVREAKPIEFYFGFLLPFISTQTGHSISELHDTFVTTIIPTITFRNYFDLTTADLTYTEQIEFVDRIKFFWRRFSGKYVPDRDEIIMPGIHPWPDVNSSEFKRRWRL